MKSIDQIFKEFDRLINPINTEIENLILDAMPALIEGFIEFYGEEAREEITEKFNRIKIVLPPMNIYRIFEDIITPQLRDYMKAKHPSEYEEFSYIEYLAYPESRYNKSQEYINDCDEILKKIVPFQELLNRYFKLKHLLEKKVAEELELDAELNTFVKAILKQQLNYPAEMINLNEYTIRNISGSLNIKTIFSAFATGDFYKINKPHELDHRIYILRKLGINIPTLAIEEKNLSEVSDEEFEAAKDEFYKLINEPNINRYLPSQEVAQKILDKYQSLATELENKVNSGLATQFYGIKNDFSNYLGFEAISALDTSEAGSFTPYLINNDGKMEIGGILSINKFLHSLEQLGITLIHEGNHGIEANVVYDDRAYMLTSGWDSYDVRDSITHKSIRVYDNKGYRPLELLNECINEFITIEILDNVKKITNNIIFSKPLKSGYANAFFVVEEFYQLYKPEIIESRNNNNMDALYQKIGKENFEALAELMRRVSRKLYTEVFDFNNAWKDLANGIENEQTKFLMDIIQQRDLILNNIKEYSQSTYKTRGNITINSIIILLMSTFILLYIIITIVK